MQRMTNLLMPLHMLTMMHKMKITSISRNNLLVVNKCVLTFQ